MKNNPELVKWVVDRLKKEFQGLNTEARISFLKAMRDNPQGIKRHFSQHVDSWPMIMALETCFPVFVSDVQTVPEEVYEELKLALAEEINGLPTP